MDIWNKEKRSAVMSKIRGKNTKPEMILRSALFLMGYRYRIHSKHLPGKPDIVFAKYKTVIFVQGCFWHLHKDCREGRIPTTNSEYWREKLQKNVNRDKINFKKLKSEDWNVIIVWECEIEKKLDKILDFIVSKLKN